MRGVCMDGTEDKWLPKWRYNFYPSREVPVWHTVSLRAVNYQDKRLKSCCLAGVWLCTRCRRVVCLPSLRGCEPLWLISQTHGQCEARPKVTFPAAGHHHPLTDTKYLVTEASVCKQLAHNCYLITEVEWPVNEPASFPITSPTPYNHYNTTPWNNSSWDLFVSVCNFTRQSPC